MYINNYKLKKAIGNWLKEAFVAHPVMFKVNYDNQSIHIYTDHPGYLIGRAGVLFNKYEKIIKQEVSSDIQQILLHETELAYSYYKNKKGE